MNRFLFLLVLSLSGFLTSAQVNVKLSMDQQLDGKPFAYQQATQSDQGYAFEMTRLQYYVSEIKLIHDGGIITPVPDFYILIDSDIRAEFELGSYDITTLEKLEFSIGVDNAHNHLDPASYPNDHPLAPQNPSMHWGWTAGYRFIAIEGFAGADSNSLNNYYEIHTIGDQNYRVISLDVTGELNDDIMEIRIQADYEKFLNNVDVSSGLISHGATGASRTIADNATSVFSATQMTSVIDADVHGSFEMFPNPATTLSTVNVDMPGYKNITCTVMDLAGQVLYTKEITGANQSFVLETNWQPGIYFVRLTDKDKLLAIRKLIVE